MRTSRTLSFFAPVLVAVLLATGAGGRTVTSATAPTPWAKQVCSSLGTWLDALERASETAAGAGGDAADAKKALTKMLKSAKKATSSAQAKLKAAGTPKAPGGKQIAGFVNGGFAQVARTIAQAQKTVARAKTKDPARFVAKARAAQDGLEAGLESQQAALASASDADTASLVKAFAKQASCARPVRNEEPPGVAVEPPEAPAGTTVSVAPSGVDEAATTACFGSSAFATEFLAADGTRLGTGGETLDVSASAAPGRAWVRLVCYLPDATGRRVIHGMCAPFTVSGEGAPPAEATSDASCPPTPRLVLSQSVLAAEAALSTGFNPVLLPLEF
jgi:hypothetical protein